MTEALDQLNQNGIKISLLTTKGQDQADKIINHFNLRKYFSFVMGRRNDIAIKPSPEPLHFICSKLKVNESDTIMTGDSEIDIICGKNAGALSCAVTYGYRSKEDLEFEKPDFIINDFRQILNII